MCSMPAARSRSTTRSDPYPGIAGSSMFSLRAPLSASARSQTRHSRASSSLNTHQQDGDFGSRDRRPDLLAPMPASLELFAVPDIDEPSFLQLEEVDLKPRAILL